MEAYAIWMAVPHRDIRDVKELVGIVIGLDEANAVLAEIRSSEKTNPGDGSRFWKEQTEILEPSRRSSD